MKMKLTLLLFTAVVLSITACKKDKDQGGRYFFTAVKNNNNWESIDLSASKHPNADTISIFARAAPPGTKLPEETLRLVIPSFKPGTYEAVRKDTFFWNTLGLDAVVAEYKMADVDKAQVTIKDYNASTMTIKGTFSVTLTKKYPASASTDKLEMKEGKFFVHFTQR